MELADRDPFDLADAWFDRLDIEEELELQANGPATPEAVELAWMQAHPLPARRYLILTYLGIAAFCLIVWAALIAGTVWVVKEVF